MKSHATAATLVGAALVSAAAALAQTPTTPGRAMKGTLVETTVPSTNVPSPAPRRGEANAIPITYYLPKNYDANRTERYPLLIQLHSGGERGHGRAARSGDRKRLGRADGVGHAVCRPRILHEFQGRFAEVGRLRDEGFATLHAQKLQRGTGSGGHVHHGHLDGRHGFAAHGGEVSGSIPGGGQPGTGHRARAGIR